MAILAPVRRVLVSLSLAAAILLGASSALIGVCGPFTDVAADAFCPFVLEIFYLGITAGTTATTYDPAGNVTRLQMAAFLSRTVDGVLKRGNRRAAMQHFWTSQNGSVLGLTTVGSGPVFCAPDGADVWVSNSNGLSVSRVRASDGKLLETWTGFTGGSPGQALAAMGRIVVPGNPNNLYTIDPSQSAGSATPVASNLGDLPLTVAFDGARFWTGNQGTAPGNGSVSIVTPGSVPWSATTVTSGFSNPASILFDGTNVWAADFTPGTLLKLDATGAILQTVTVGSGPNFPVFDGTNIWVPNRNSNSVSVVRASSGAVLQTLTANGLNLPFGSAFDGQTIMVSEANGNVVSLWKAADLTPLGFFQSGFNTNPVGVCSDGLNFWVVLTNVNKLARF